MNETFADSITGLIFEGQMLRIELGVTRFDEMKPNAPISGRRYPACRLAAHLGDGHGLAGDAARRCDAERDDGRRFDQVALVFEPDVAALDFA